MSQLDPQQRELAALGASLASNCIPCIKYHVQKGREAGLADEEIAEAIEVADEVRKVPARKVREAATAALGQESPSAAPAAKGTCRSPFAGGDFPAMGMGMGGSPCCGPGGGS